MIIKCPQCSSTYDVPSATAVQGRKVRCTRCAHVWRAEVIDGEASAAADPPTASNQATMSAAQAGAADQSAASPRPHTVAPVPATAQLGSPVNSPAALAAAPSAGEAPPPSRAAQAPAPANSSRTSAPQANARAPQPAGADDFDTHRDVAEDADPDADGSQFDDEHDDRPAAAAPRPEQRAAANRRSEPAHSVPGENAALGNSAASALAQSNSRRAPAERPRTENGEPFWSARQTDAWEEVESSLSKVTNTTRQPARPHPRSEARPELSIGRNDERQQQPGARPEPARSSQPPTRARPPIPDGDWARANGNANNGRSAVNGANGAASNGAPASRQPPRPELDDEGFWREHAAKAADPWPEDTDPDADFMAEAVDPTPRRGGGNALAVVGWLFFAGIVAGLIAFLYVGRASVVRALPGAAPIYASAGLPINVRGLEFRDITYKWGIDRKGRPAMTIAGRVINISQTPQTVPSVAFVFLDAAEAELFNWATPIRDKPLAPGKSTSFEARIPAPPEAVANLQVRFAKAK